MARLTSPHARSDALTEAQRAVAIRVLGWRLRVEYKLRALSSVKVLGCQRPRRRRTVAATGITACHPVVPSGQKPP